MQNYNYYKSLVGPEPVIPQQENIVYAYKAGEVRKFESGYLARQFSDLVEIVIVNEDEIKKSHEAYDNWCADVRALWRADIRGNFPEITDRAFNVCYDKVAANNACLDYFLEEMEDLVRFALDIMSENIEVVLVNGWKNDRK